MEKVRQYLDRIAMQNIHKVVISKPASKALQFKKVVAERKGNACQLSKYTDTQVFHENIGADQLADACERLICEGFLQLNAWDLEYEYILLISRKGQCTFKRNAAKSVSAVPAENTHNRSKNYVLEASADILPLVDMGVFTKEGKVVSSMYDKYRQINRYLEIIDDAIRDLPDKSVNIIDFGCGKSYLTFIVYYYLTYVRNIRANMIGLDLKEDVIKKCNEAAERYGYDGLRFELGDINGYKAPFDVDIVMTLHACDTATDYALYNAINWNAKMIFSVPCCQHELNKQIKTDDLSIMTRYGIIQERFSALATDAIRANLLEYCGYRTQLLEFTDFSHTPKNILIRAVRKTFLPKSHRQRMLDEVHKLMEEFHFMPTLYTLLFNEVKP